MRIIEAYADNLVEVLLHDVRSSTDLMQGSATSRDEHLLMATVLHPVLRMPANREGRGAR